MDSKEDTGNGLNWVVGSTYKARNGAKILITAVEEEQLVGLCPDTQGYHFYDLKGNDQIYFTTPNQYDLMHLLQDTGKDFPSKKFSYSN